MNERRNESRGVRIELGEIESQLQGHALVHACVVVAREDVPGNRQLVAYVVLADTAEASDYQAVLRTHLQSVLPEYMVPSAYVALEALPLTPNGKVNRKALPAPDAAAYAQDAYVAPQTETEKLLVQIWSELLGLPAEDISVTANFFALGGHSLKAGTILFIPVYAIHRHESLWPEPTRFDPARFQGERAGHDMLDIRVFTGGSHSHQWGYRTTSGGTITNISGQTGTSYVLNCANFPAAGSYFLVARTTPGCGSTLISNEIPVTVTSVPASDPGAAKVMTSCGWRSEKGEAPPTGGPGCWS